MQLDFQPPAPLQWSKLAGPHAPVLRVDVGDGGVVLDRPDEVVVALRGRGGAAGTAGRVRATKVESSHVWKP